MTRATVAAAKAAAAAAPAEEVGGDAALSRDELVAATASLLRGWAAGADGDAEVYAEYYQAKVPLQASPPPGTEPPPPLPLPQLARYVGGWCAELLRGVAWTLHYYLAGPPSWSWFFPYHHSPLLVHLATTLRAAPALIQPKWAPSRPVRPFTQLLAVLPPASAPLLPPPYANLLLAASGEGGGDGGGAGGAGWQHV